MAHRKRGKFYDKITIDDVKLYSDYLKQAANILHSGLHFAFLFMLNLSQTFSIALRDPDIFKI